MKKEFILTGVLILFIIVFCFLYILKPRRIVEPIKVTYTSQKTTQIYKNDQYGFILNYPLTLEATSTFGQSYMIGSGWNLYADPIKSTGISLVSLKKKESNEVMNAELRIGISTTTSDISTCIKVQPSIKTSSILIHGITFTTFNSGGAAMMHFSQAKSYRTIHNQICYAIDEFINGTNPQVYVPSKVAPFTKEEAFKNLDQALQSFTFTR